MSEGNSTYKGIIQESKDLLDALYKNQEIGTEIVSSTDRLRENVMTFISERLKDITRKELLTNLLDAELVRKLTLHELNAEQLMDLRTSLSIDKNSSINSVLDLFKPANGNGSNTLLPPPQTNAGGDDLLKNITPEGRSVVNKLMLIVQKMQEQESKEENN